MEFLVAELFVWRKDNLYLDDSFCFNKIEKNDFIGQVCMEEI